MTTDYTQHLTSLFKSHQNDENAWSMKKYMKNQFEFLGNEPLPPVEVGVSYHQAKRCFYAYEGLLHIHNPKIGRHLFP